MWVGWRHRLQHDLAGIQTPLAQTTIPLAGIQTYLSYTPLLFNNEGKVSLQKEAARFESEV